MNNDEHPDRPSLTKQIRHTIFGKPRNIKDPSLFHKLTLIPVLAWIGLGADGLSSSSYGPEEAFKSLGPYSYLAVFLMLATAFTVFIISFSYSRIIEHFPTGGGGYIVATHMLGESAGVISGSALLVDYILTITVSLVSCTDALFSFLPMDFHQYKITFTCLLIIFLIILNLRGVKESIAILSPIFIIFVVTHVILIAYGMGIHADQVVPKSHQAYSDLQRDLSVLGWFGILKIFLHAYSLGGGTYTGIEAVSNGLQVMREPRVQTGKKTMFYMALSLAFTAGGLLLCYFLIGVTAIPGKTFNAILAESLYSRLPMGVTLAFITILSEGALLLVGAQTGFVDGPRVMANMAVDSWFPRRFASLSERFTMQNGVLLMGGSAMVLTLYTHGSISALLVMYSINVFLTFTLSQFGMSRFFIQQRKKIKYWKRNLSVHVIGFILCLVILLITGIDKFDEGGWLTFLITIGIIILCYVIKNHYKKVGKAIRKLNEILMEIPLHPSAGPVKIDPKSMTAIQLVGDFNGFGIHTLLSVARNFPNLYKNVVFASVAVIDSGSFKGEHEIEALKKQTQESLNKYVELARGLGFASDSRYEMGTDVVETATSLCKELKKEFSSSTVFMGQLTFQMEKFYHRLLHNQTAFAIQRNLHWAGITPVILPIRVQL